MPVPAVDEASLTDELRKAVSRFARGLPRKWRLPSRLPGRQPVEFRAADDVRHARIATLAAGRPSHLRRRPDGECKQVTIEVLANGLCRGLPPSS